MNCKPGDLAIARQKRFNRLGDVAGLIVTVVRAASAGEVTVFNGQRVLWLEVAPTDWLVEHPERGQWVHEDSSLTPIRPGDLEDETPTVRDLEVAR